MEPAAKLTIHEKRYTPESSCVIRDLSFDIRAGETLCVIGPSGAGKSTLLNILSDIDDDFIGEVSQPLQNASRGIVFQQPRLMPWLDVMQNLLLPCSHELAEKRRRGRKLLQALGLGDVISRYPRQLSIGMQRRVALVRALLCSPELLLLDEPFVSLDAPTAERARELLCREVTPGTTVVLFTHDLREAVALGDRLLFLSEAPARVALEVPVDISCSAAADSREVAAFCRTLMERHPQLLSGKTAQTLKVAT